MAIKTIIKDVKDKALSQILNEKALGVGPYGVKMVKIILIMPQFSNKENLQNEVLCKRAIEDIQKVVDEGR